MCVVILGSGVVGVVSVWYLSQVGYDVMVIDCQFGLVEEISVVNVGQIFFGYVVFWVVLGVLLKVIKWMFQCYVLLVIGFDGILFQLKWMWQMLCNCDICYYMENKGCMVCLVEYSCDCLKVLCDIIGIQYEGCQGGMLQLFCIVKQYENVICDIVVLEDVGVLYQLLEVKWLVEVELVLVEVSYKLIGGLCLLNDEIGDCQLFIICLVVMVEQVGVIFCFNIVVDVLLYEGDCIVGVKCGDEIIKGDVYVMVFGFYLMVMFKGLVDILVYLLKGYLLIILIVQEDGVLVLIIFDEIYKIVIICFDQCIWVGGMVEIVGFNKVLLQQCCEILEMVVCDLFLCGGYVEQVIFWMGLWLMMLDGMLVVGCIVYKNLWFNIGYGMFGWIMVCGFGQFISDLIFGCMLVIFYDDLVVVCYSFGFILVCLQYLYGVYN